MSGTGVVWQKVGLLQANSLKYLPEMLTLRSERGVTLNMELYMETENMPFRVQGVRSLYRLSQLI